MTHASNQPAAPQPAGDAKQPPRAAPSRPLLFWLAVLLLFLGLGTLWTGYVVWKRNAEGVVGSGGSSGNRLGGSGEENAGPQLTEFEYRERSGRLFNSRELLGRVWVANFFFASCPTTCPRQTEVMARFAREFGPRGVRFVSISVDEENDTPSTLREYANRYGAHEEHWLFLSGKYDYTKRVAKDIFQVPLEFERGIHSEALITVDRDGRLRRYTHWNDPEALDDLRALLNEMLAEPEPSAAPAESPEGAASPDPAGDDAGG